MQNIDLRIADMLPSHFKGSAPRFITFLQKYYEWLYRSSGLSQSEVDDLKADTSWLQEDIDKFIATGQLRYFDPTAAPDKLDDAITVLNQTIGPGAHADNLRDNFLMEGGFNGYSANDDTATPGTADPSVEHPTIENSILDGWFNSMGFDRIKRSKLKSMDNIDQVLMISILKHIYAIKGTESSIKLFFNLLFDEDVTVFQPKTKLAVADEQFVLDDLNSVLRDDEEYQEFSYVIVVAKDTSYYQDVFQSLYMSTVHPSGFRVDLRQSDYSETGLQLENGGYLLLEPGIYLSLG